MSIPSLDLFENIRQARQQISKLKQEASILEADPYNANNCNLREMTKNVAYSLGKSEQQMGRKIAEFKSRLPSIHRQERAEIDTSMLGAYKKYRKVYKQPALKRNSQQSTKVQSSLSFSVQNRPMKIHSDYEKHYKPEYSFIDQTQAALPKEVLQLREELISSEKQISEPKQFGFQHRRNFSAQKKKLKYVDINSSSTIKQCEDVLRPPEEYESIVDKYSKHEFMIINGKTANEGPQFASYVRIYSSILGRIKEELAKLEALLQEKKVRFAKFDGKKLAYLCLKDSVKKSELIDCLIDDSGQLRGLLIPASKYAGKKGKDVAARKIQALFKMSLVRQKYLLLKSKAVIIQRFFQRKLLMLQLEKKIYQRNTKIISDFESRQEDLEQRWKQIKKSKRIEIHVNSIEVDEFKRLSIENFSERENIQLSRIFRLRDENLILIYVSSTELPPELINYYYKMLELAGVPKYNDRLLFFTPKVASQFPKHFSASKLLYYSSQTLKQLKIITEDLPTLLVPGYPSNELIKICDFLQCYLYAGSPQKTKPFTTRSQTLSFFRNLSLPVLPSAMEMYDYGQFLNTFSVLMMKHPQTKTWLLKIDDEFGGRGVAYFDASKSKVIQSLLAKISYPGGGEFFTTDISDVISEPQNQQITIKIRDYLRENLSQRLKIATPTVYRSYSEFMGRFIKKGGVIEAKPTVAAQQKLLCCSISFSVDPVGEVNIICTYDKMMGSPYRSYACSFPQKAIDTKEALSVVQRISESFRIRKIFGYFTVDLLVLVADRAGTVKSASSIQEIDPAKTSKTYWVIDMDPYINDCTSSFFVFDALMGGKYFADKNVYLAEKEMDKGDDYSVDTMTSQANQNLPPLIEREYTFLAHFFNQNLFMVKIKQFFKQARVQRFNFDVGNKEGLCVLLLDTLTSGTMSLLAVSGSAAQNVGQIKSILEFIVKLSGIKNVAYGKTDCEPSTDRILIKDMLNLFLTIVRKDERSQSKAKALKQYENNQRLQLIF